MRPALTVYTGSDAWIGRTPSGDSFTGCCLRRAAGPTSFSHSGSWNSEGSRQEVRTNISKPDPDVMSQRRALPQVDSMLGRSPVRSKPLLGHLPSDLLTGGTVYTLLSQAYHQA